MAINSAATVVSAVLETAGYVSQATVLNSFGSFWQSAGYFIYLLSCFAGLISLVISGSFRGARYLLIGPSLFYILVLNRADIAPVMWKLGPKDAVSVQDEFIGPLAQYRPSGAVNVSWAFRTYARISNEITRQLSEIILSYEDNQDLLFVARNQALYSLLTTAPAKPELMGMLSFSLINQCSEMMNTILALSAQQYSSEHFSQLGALAATGDQPSAAALAYLQGEKATLQQKLTTASAATRITASKDMEEFIYRETAQVASGAGTDYAARLGFGDRQAFLRSGGSMQSITCGQALEVFGDAAMKDGRWLEKVLEDKFVGTRLTDTPENRLALCNKLASNLHQDFIEGNGCNLGLAAMITMLRNVITGTGLGAIADENRKQMNLISGESNVYCADKIHESGEDRLLRSGKDSELEYGSEKFQDLTTTRTALTARRKGSNDQFCRAYSVDAPGMSSTAFGDQQRYDTRGLLQGIYSYALNIPYYQGVILYFLAIAHPFCALFVLVPGKAKNFLYVPLAWLWVKSWDVGFAAVMVLDRILWNLLPRTDLPYQSTAPGTDIMPDLLGAVLRVDPTYDIHAHFNYIAMALFAVPAITGGIIMKGKQMMFSAVSSGVDERVQNSEQTARNVFGQYLQHDRLEKVSALQGMGRLSLGSYGAGVLHQDSRTQDALKYGAVSAGIRSMRALVDSSTSSGPGAAKFVNGAFTALSKGSTSAGRVLMAETRAQAEKVATFDDTFGIDSALSRKIRANVAAFDGSDRFELMSVRGRGRDVWKTDLDSLITKVELYQEWAQDILGGVAGAAGRLSPNVLGGGGAALDWVINYNVFEHARSSQARQEPALTINPK